MSYRMKKTKENNITIIYYMFSGADCGNSELDAADPPIATISLRSDTLAASSLTLQEESDDNKF